MTQNYRDLIFKSQPAVQERHSLICEKAIPFYMVFREVKVMITNGEARDKYKEDYDKASEHYIAISRESENYQTIISENRSISQQLDGELKSIQDALDEYNDLLSTCKRLRDEDYVEENNQIKEYSSKFQCAITYSETSIDVESYYIGNMKNIADYLEAMIEKINDVIVSLEDKKKEVSDKKMSADETLNTARKQLNNMESKSSVSARIEDSYQWYKYYLSKCEEEGEDADSGLY